MINEKIIDTYKNMKKQNFPFYVLLSIVATAIIFSSCSRDEPEIDNPKTTDAGVVINGVRWATRNVDMPGTFAEKPESFGMFYQWNRRVGWSSTDPMINSEGGTEWNTTLPTGTEWTKNNDPCPPGWRIPTFDEILTLYNSVVEWATVNGVTGAQIGTVPNTIFLPATGWRTIANGTISGAGFGGFYWSSTRDTTDGTRARFFGFSSSCVDLSNLRPTRVNGVPVRCVAE